METREWKTIKEYQDILFDFYNGIAKITINRPRYRKRVHPPPPLRKSATPCITAASARISM